jgi:hypothetical protein
MKHMVSDRDVRQQNRRVGFIIVALLALLYLIAIAGVLMLN